MSQGRKKCQTSDTKTIVWAAGDFRKSLFNYDHNLSVRLVAFSFHINNIILFIEHLKGRQDIK